MRTLKRYWREIACVFLFTFLLQIILWLSMGVADTSFGRFALALAAAVDFFSLLALLRQLWRRKWREALSRAVRSVLTGASRFVIRLLEKWNIGKHRSGNVLGGRMEFTFDAMEGERATKRPKRKKWKHMQNERERLGFLYGHMIRERIKGGMRATRYDTPSELCERQQNSDIEAELFELYINTRYDERKTVGERDVEHLRGGLGVK